MITKEEQEFWTYVSLTKLAIEQLCLKYGIKIDHDNTDWSNFQISFKIDYFEAHHTQFLQELEELLSND